MRNASDIRDMERCFLGSLLMGAEKGKAETRLKADDFDNKNHGRIFETILKQWNEGTTPTIRTLFNALSPDIQASEIAELTSLVPSDANLTYYENQIFEASKTRRFIKALQQAKEEVDAHTAPYLAYPQSGTLGKFGDRHHVR